MSEIENNSPLPGDRFRVLAREKAFVLVFTLSAVLTALALTYIFSEEYETSVTIFYRPQEVTRLKGMEAQAFGSPVPSAPFKVISQTLEGVVKSEVVLRPVVETLGLDEEGVKVGGSWYMRVYREIKSTIKEYLGYAWMLLKYGRIIERDPIIKAMVNLHENIKVENKDSYIFRLIVRDKNPKRAALIVEAVADGVVAWLQKQDTNPGEQKHEQLASLLRRKTSEIAAYHEQIQSLLWANNIASVPAEIETGMARLSEMELARANVDSRIQEGEAKLAHISGKMELKGKMGRGEGGLGNPEHIQPEDFKRLASEKVATGVELSGLRASRDSLQKSIDQLNARLKKLPIIQNELDGLHVSLDAAKRDYVQLNDTYQEAMVRATGKQSQVEILHQAHVPATPVAPIKIYHVGLAGTLALVISIGFVYVLSYFNIRIFFHSLGLKGRRGAAPAR